LIIIIFKKNFKVKIDNKIKITNNKKIKNVINAEMNVIIIVTKRKGKEH
jgi:hypothetical protein